MSVQNCSRCFGVSVTPAASLLAEYPGNPPVAERRRCRIKLCPTQVADIPNPAAKDPTLIRGPRPHRRGPPAVNHYSLESRTMTKISVDKSWRGSPESRMHLK